MDGTLDGSHERDHEAAGRVVERLQTQPVLRAGCRSGERIVFPDRGRIVEEGRHDALLRRGGLYAEFRNASLAPAPSE
ncbi:MULTISPECIES: hypothetical protein [Streptomyces]|nr:MULTISPECIES: hypothetical protein [Streptomyces]MCM9083204.1 hypothetical protein [Streptomyces spororaveus]MCX5302194.1 hypothetical protein [Streptomyces sp. NBC_00160]